MAKLQKNIMIDFGYVALVLASLIVTALVKSAYNFNLGKLDKNNWVTIYD